MTKTEKARTGGPRLNLSAFAWRNAGGKTWDPESEAADDSALFGAMTLGTTPMHVEAIRVVKDGHGIQTAEDPAFQGDFDYICNLCADGPLWTTVEIPLHKGEYVIVIYPFAL